MTALSASESRKHVGENVIIVFTHEGAITAIDYGIIESDKIDVWVDSSESQRFWFIEESVIDKTLFFIPISQIQIPA